MAWGTPIIDRTTEDVAYAMLNQISTSELKGAFNPSDYNRIVDNITFLKTALNAQGYYPTISVMSYVTDSDLPYIHSKMDLLRDNVNSIVNCFYKYNNRDIKYGNVFSYDDANIIEENLKITKELLDKLVLSFIYCGRITCGETFAL